MKTIILSSSYYGFVSETISMGNEQHKSWLDKSSVALTEGGACFMGGMWWWGCCYGGGGRKLGLYATLRIKKCPTVVSETGWLFSLCEESWALSADFAAVK